MNLLSAIQLRAHWFEALELKANPDFSPEANQEEDYEIQVQFPPAQKVTGREHHWQARLGVLLSPGKTEQPYRYEGRIEVTGVFETHPDCSETLEWEMVRMNGGSLLMGAVREVIAQFTARSRWGVLELPCFDARIFLEQAKETGAVESETQ
jgi:hypothetical protein